MKKILLITFLVLFFTNQSYAQHVDYIVFTNKKPLYNVKIHQITDVYLMYEKDGSLHDALYDDIVLYRKEGVIVRIDKNEKTTDYFTESDSDIGVGLNPEVTTKISTGKPKEKTLFQKIVSMFI